MLRTDDMGAYGSGLDLPEVDESDATAGTTRDLLTYGGYGDDDRSYGAYGESANRDMTRESGPEPAVETPEAATAYAAAPEAAARRLLTVDDTEAGAYGEDDRGGYGRYGDEPAAETPEAATPHDSEAAARRLLTDDDTGTGAYGEDDRGGYGSYGDEPAGRGLPERPTRPESVPVARAPEDEVEYADEPDMAVAVKPSVAPEEYTEEPLVFEPAEAPVGDELEAAGEGPVGLVVSPDGSVAVGV